LIDLALSAHEVFDTGKGSRDAETIMGEDVCWLYYEEGKRRQRKNKLERDKTATKTGG